MTEAQKAAYRLYSATPGERIRTHRQVTAEERKLIKRRAARRASYTKGARHD